MPNPLLRPSTLPYELPDFAAIEEGLTLGMAEQIDEVRAITCSAEAACFENTVEALERSGQVLDRAQRVLDTLVASVSTPELRELDARMAPLLAAHQDAIVLNDALFARIDAVYAARAGLDDEARALVERYRTEAWLAGAGLDEPSKSRLSEINARLAELKNRFETNLLADTHDLAVVFTDAGELDGLSDADLSACAAAAVERGVEGYVVNHVLYSQHPYLARLTVRESRRRLFEAGQQRGIRGNEYDNTDAVREMVTLRAERAGLLGYPHHADARLADQTATSAERVKDVVYPLAGPAARNAEVEASDLQAAIDAEAEVAGTDRFDLQAWDWAYYTEKVRAERFSLDGAALRSYFPFERVLHDGVFFAAGQLYGVRFEQRPDLRGYHPDVDVYEVFEADGSPLGLVVYDLYARDGKRGGAWMNSLVPQSDLFGRRPIVCQNLNVPKPAAGSPTLLTLEQVRTAFHEFGHALHGLFSAVRYPKLGGTHVPRDVVEFPSQVNEVWMTWPEVVTNYARHHETGEPLPPEALEALAASETFNEGFATSEYLGAALLDQEWHKLAPDAAVESVEAFERDALKRVGLADPLIPPRYRSSFFAHVFSSGYDAAYYSYIWSEVLDADTVEWFRENGGLTRANGDRFRAEFLSRGRSRDPLESYRAFRGRDAVIEPLLRRRALV